MNPLRRIENAIAGLVEGGFGRVFRSEVRPMELAHKLAREMDEHATASVSRTYAPNEYAVWLSERDRARYEGVENEVIEELCAYLLEHARAEGFALASAPRIYFRTDEQLELGEFGIEARINREEDGGEHDAHSGGHGAGGDEHGVYGGEHDARGGGHAGDGGGQGARGAQPDRYDAGEDREDRHGRPIPPAAASRPVSPASSAYPPRGAVPVSPARPPRPSSPAAPGVSARGPEREPEEPVEGGHTMIYSGAERVREAVRGTSAARRPKAMLLVSGRRVVVPSRGAVLGRSRECDVVLDDSSVSRRHAELRPQGSDWTIQDLGSTNGVRVNGRTLHGVRVLRDGDRVELGSTEMHFEVGR